MKKNIFVACDLSNEEEAINLIEQIKDDIFGIKVGLQYCRSWDRLYNYKKSDMSRSRVGESEDYSNGYSRFSPIPKSEIRRISEVHV